MTDRIEALVPMPSAEEISAGLAEKLKRFLLWNVPLVFWNCTPPTKVKFAQPARRCWRGWDYRKWTVFGPGLSPTRSFDPSSLTKLS